jgi:hypothetical protein
MHRRADVSYSTSFYIHVKHVVRRTHKIGMIRIFRQQAYSLVYVPADLMARICASTPRG